MIPRGTIIAALLVVELAIVGEAAVALRGGPPAAVPLTRTEAPAAGGPRLAEGGPHKIFAVGAHPALNVEIGYADLTIFTGSASQVDVSVSPSDAYGFFQATGAITAREDGETIRVAAIGGRRWSMGDDRMVTVVVPPGTAVTVVSAGDIKANGLRAEASFNSVGMGSVTVEDFAAPALHVATSNGRIVLHRIAAARLDVTSNDGRVEGAALQVRDGSIQSDGRVTLGFAAGSNTLVNATASSGRVSASGLGDAESPPTVRAHGAEDDDSSSQTVRVGAGEGRLDVHSNDGNIILARDG